MTKLAPDVEVSNLLMNTLYYLIKGLLEGLINMIQFMGCLNQIEFFVRFKADRSLKCLQYDPYVYHVVYQ